MSSPVASVACTTSPFLLERDEKLAYDMSMFAQGVGEAFVLASCTEVRRQRDTAGVSPKTWWDNYVNTLGVLLVSLLIYFKGEPGTSTAAVLTAEGWQRFGSFLSLRMNSQAISDRTKTKRIYIMNKLLTILAAAAVIPVRLELIGPFHRTRAKDGESKLTQKGWGRKPQTEEVRSAYLVHIVDHGRSYDYAPYRQLGHHFLLQMARSLAVYYRGLRTGHAKQVHNTLTDFLRYLTEERQSGNHSKLFAALGSDNFASISATLWEQALYGWRDATHPNSERAKLGRALQTAHQIVKRLDGIWAHLASARLVPHVTVVGFKNANRLSRGEPRPSLARLAPSQVITVAAEKQLVERISKFFGDTEHAQVHDFIRALCHELSSESVRKISMASLVDEIHALNAKRLQELRQCVEADFLRWHAHWLRGQAALATASHSPVDLIFLLDSPTLSVSQRRRNSAALLFSAPEETRLGNALAYVLATQDGIATGVHGRYHHLMRSFGGRGTFHAYLHPHPDATLALWVLLMVDTGANCEVVRAMPYDCIQATNDPGSRKLVFAAKGRAGYKVIVDELRVAPDPGTALSSIDAIERYKLMSARYRALAEPLTAQSLLLDEHEARVCPLTEWTARAWFVAMTKRHGELAELNALPSFIRPSVLLELHNRGGTGVVAAQEVADHVSSTTTLNHYTGRVPTKLVYAHKIREFQDRFQAVIIVSIEGAAEKLGISPDEFERVLSDAARTGLGVACLNPRAGIQPGTLPGKDCTRLDACPGCSMRWVVGTVANIADLMLFNEYLKGAQINAQAQQLEAWEQRWLPWLVFSDIALSKLSQGETASAFVQAQQVVAHRRPTYQHFPLF